MLILLDTQIAIWILTNPGKLPIPIYHTLKRETPVVSEISLFEIAIKQKLGKLPELVPAISEIAERLIEDGIELIPLAVRHISAYDQIPLFDDHRDPFDRLILATALAERMPVISADEKFTRYRDVVELIW